MDHADDGIELLLVDRQAAMAGLGKGLDQLGEAARARHGDDVGAGDGDVGDIALAEMEQVAKHLALDRGEIAHRRALALMAFDRFLYLLAQGLLAVAAEQEGPQAAPEAGLLMLVAVATVLVRH